jgi:hypothetical protein
VGTGDWDFAEMRSRPSGLASPSNKMLDQRSTSGKLHGIPPGGPKSADPPLLSPVGREQMFSDRLTVWDG